MAEFDYVKYKEIRSTTYVLCTLAAGFAIAAGFVAGVAVEGTNPLVFIVLHGPVLLISVCLFNTYRKQEGKIFKTFTKYSVLACVFTVAVCFINIFLPGLLNDSVQISRGSATSAAGLLSYGHAVVVALPMIEFIKLNRIINPPEKLFSTTTPYMKKEYLPEDDEDLDEEDY